MEAAAAAIGPGILIARQAVSRALTQAAGAVT